jgi:hypothetical protein
MAPKRCAHLDEVLGKEPRTPKGCEELQVITPPTMLLS